MKYYFDDIFNDNIFGSFTTKNERSHIHPTAKCNVYEEKGSFIIELFVPGFSKNDITVDVKNNTLFASGKTDVPTKYKHIRQEYARLTTFERSWQLPKGTNIERIDATYDTGILRIVVPLIQEKYPESKKINVQ